MAHGEDRSTSAVSVAVGSQRKESLRIPTAIWGANDESRLLLRGILQLHRYPLTREARSRGELERLPAETRVLIYDTGWDATGWTGSVADVAQETPGLRVLVLLPTGSERPGSEGRGASALATLTKPFTTRDLIEAIDALVAEPGRP